MYPYGKLPKYRSEDLKYKKEMTVTYLHVRVLAKDQSFGLDPLCG